MGCAKGRGCPSPIAVPFPWRLITVPWQFSISESQSLIEDQGVIDEYETSWVEDFKNLPSPRSEQRRKKRKPKGEGGENKPKLDDLDADNPVRGNIVKLDDLDADNPEKGNTVKVSDLKSRSQQIPDILKPLNEMSERERCRKLLRSFAKFT